MRNNELAKFNLPTTPGVYFFRKGKDILYIGKATSLRDRTKSYFAKDLIETRGPLILDMVFKADNITYQETDSVLEALILEAHLIKHHQPYYNTREKDDKSWNYVCITKEDLPMILLVRGKEIDFDKKLAKGFKLDTFYGPFINGLQLKEAMKIVRRIFPFIDLSSSKSDNYQFYRQLGLTPDLGVISSPPARGGVDRTRDGVVGADQKSKHELGFPIKSGMTQIHAEAVDAYKRNIRNIKLFFQGKKKDILKDLQKEMKTAAKDQRFEEAGRIRNQIFSLDHINDIALLKNENQGRKLKSGFRIECYDVAHLSGKNMVGVMTVIEDGEINKKEYRTFNVRGFTASNDTGALEEILSRRLRHTEWGMPDLVVTDGGEAQLRIARQVLKRYQLPIPAISVVKDEHHKPKDILGDEPFRTDHKKMALLGNSEAHRFSIKLHRNQRDKNFLA